MAAGIARWPCAGEEVTDTLSWYGVGVQVPSSPPAKEWAVHEHGDATQPADRTFTGLIDTDDSLTNPHPVQARGSGWPAVKCDEEGNVTFAVCDTCPDRCSTPIVRTCRPFAIRIAGRSGLWRS